MKNLVPLFAGIAVVSSIVSVTMWRELRTERQLTADLHTQLTQSRIQPLAVAPAQQAVVAPGHQAAVAPVTDSARLAENTPAPAPATAAPSQNVARMIEDSQNQQRELMKDPEYRKARLAQQRMMIEQTYPGLAEELGLSAKDADRLFDLLNESQMNMSNEMGFVAGTADPTEMQERARRQQAMQKQMEDSVAGLLGPARYAQWQDYQESRGPRMQAGSMATQLSQAGQPLSGIQEKSLTAALVTEQKRQRQEMQAMVRSFNPNDPQGRAQMMEESLRRQEESNRRVLEAAASSLTAQQVAALRQQQETQMAMNRATLRLERARIESQVPPAPGQPVSGVVTLPAVSF